MTRIVASGVDASYFIRKSQRSSAPMPHGSVGAPIVAGRRYLEIKALQDITVTLEKGDRIGLVGMNGAGKSTFLRLCAGALAVQKGSIDIEGRVSPQFSLGAGIRNALTGRRNAQLKCLYMGVPLRSIARRVQEVGQLSGLGEYFDLPVSTYSQGMRSRLIMSLLRLMRGNILVLDEWISVADASLMESLNRLQSDLLSNSDIVVMASHAKPVLMQWTNSLIWLHQGRIREMGPTSEVYPRYEAWMKAGGEMAESSDAPGTGQRSLVPAKDQPGQAAGVVEDSTRTQTPRKPKHRQVRMAGNFKYRFFLPDDLAAADADQARSISQRCVQDDRLLVPPVPGLEFASYTHYADGSRLDHRFYPSVDVPFEADREVVSFEVYARRSSGQRLWRFIGNPIESSIILEGGEPLYFRLTRGRGRDLVILFDYSRLVSEVKRTQEYCPSFNFVTEKHKLVIGNVFGHWGTADLFDSSGSFIVPEVTQFINDIIDQLGVERVFMIGGSQGAVAALVYGGLVAQCHGVFATVPDALHTKSMLRHLKHLIDERDVAVANELMLKTLQTRRVQLFSTVGDERWEYHRSLAERGTDVTFTLCDDPKVKHADCLKFYIKDIYAAVEAA